MKNMDTAPPRAPGTEVLPGHRIIDHLSRGRHLDVHDVWSEERGTRCVVKLLRPDMAGDRPAARRLDAEARLLRRLEHPHIVRGYRTPGATEPMVMMETLTGSTLSHLLATTPRRLRVPEIGHLGMHLASALRYLHSEGWLHLDLKPSNIVAQSGRAVVIDLSIARRPGRGKPGRGTWCYLAPEQARGDMLGAAADVWGLGAVLYEATTGRPAFDDPEEPDESTGDASDSEWTDASETDDTGETSYDSDDDDDYTDSKRRYPQLAGPPEPVRRLRRTPAALADLIHACLEPEADRRPTLDAVLRTLEELAEVPEGDRRFGVAPSGSVR